MFLTPLNMVSTGLSYRDVRCVQSLSKTCPCAGMALVEKHGAEHTANMLSVFEGYLEARDVADEASYDRVREGVVIFLGTLAQHLDAQGPKVGACAAVEDTRPILAPVLRSES